MSRADAYAAIKAQGLQKECVKRFGKNFTMCKTADLVALINEKSVSNTAGCIDTKARAALSRLLTILTDNDVLDDDEAEEIEDILDDKATTSDDCKPSSESSYSDDEIDRMFNFAK